MLMPTGGEEGSVALITCARFDGMGGTAKTWVLAAAGT